MLGSQEPGTFIDALFVSLVVLLSTLVVTSLSGPFVYGLHASGDFSFTCMADSTAFEEFWDNYTVTKRLFAVFMCVEMMITRSVFGLHLYRCLQLCDAGKVDRRTPLVYIFYLWTKAGLAFAMDCCLLIWAFMRSLTCDEVLAPDAANRMDAAKLHTLHPLCVQSLSIAQILCYFHMFNGGLLLVTAIIVTVLLLKKGNRM